LAAKIIFGMELGTAVELDTVSGTLTADSSTKHSGGYALSINAAQSSNYGILRPRSMNIAAAYFRYWTRVHVTTNPSGTTVSLGIIGANSTVDVFYVQPVVTAAGAISLRLYNAITSAQVGSDYSISADTWYLVKIKLIVSATVGVLEMMVGTSDSDIAVRATGSGLNTGATNLQDLYLSYYCSSLNSLGATIWYDDLLLDDSAYPADGKVLCRTAGLSGTPTYDSFTKSGGTLPTIWQDTPFDIGTTTGSPATGDPVAQTYFIAPFSATQSGHGSEVIATSDVINGAVGFVVAYYINNAAGRTYKTRRRVASVDTDSTISLVASTSNGQRETSIWVDTLANINAMEFGGVKSGGAGGDQMQIHDTYILVDYTPAASSAARRFGAIRPRAFAPGLAR
jgi:hypothetical protein